MIPGEIITQDGDIEINAGAARVTLEVANTGDRPIQVGSHYHFYETNESLRFDRDKSRGMRLDIGDDQAYDAVMHDAPAVALPVDVANHPLGSEIAIRYFGKWPQMDVGYMRKPEHGVLLGYAAWAFQPWNRSR